MRFVEDSRISLTLLAIIFVSCVNTLQAKTPGFQGLGFLSDNPGEQTSKANGVSSDGSVVVGISGTASAFMWENGLMTDLGSPYPDAEYSGGEATSASADGSVIVGTGLDFISATEAFRWENGQMVGLGDLIGDPDSSWGIYSHATGVSADGSVIVGYSQSINPEGTDAFRWENGTMIGLGDLLSEPSIVYSQATGVSADGSIVVGYCGAEFGNEAFRWEDDTMVGLGNLLSLPGAVDSYAAGISADGSVIVGHCMSEEGIQAFRWEDDEMFGLGGLDPNGIDSYATAVSADGSTIVGRSVTGSDGYQAFIWDEDNGMRSLREVLENDCGLDLDDWLLVEATGVSADGLTIVGHGLSSDGEGAWIATIPEPATLLLLGLGSLVLLKRRRA